MLKSFKVTGDLDTIFAYSGETELTLPLLGQLINASSFATMVEEWVDEEIDFNKYFIKNPATSFYGRIVSDSMEPEIHDGSFILFDTKPKPIHGSKIVVVVDGVYLAKVLWQTPLGYELRSFNRKYQPIRITEGMDVRFRGKIIATIRSF